MRELFEAIKEIFKFLNVLFMTPKKQIQRVVRIYDEMNKVMNETDIQRIVVFKVHNGGGLIKPTGDLYASIIFEDYTHPFSSTKSDYQSVPVDKGYIKILLDVIINKKLNFNVDTLSDGELRRIYLKEGIKNSVIYFLTQDRRNVYFCSCSTSLDTAGLFNPKQSVTIDLAVNKIKQNIK